MDIANILDSEWVSSQPKSPSSKIPRTFIIMCAEFYSKGILAAGDFVGNPFAHLGIPLNLFSRKVRCAAKSDEKHAGMKRRNSA